LLASLAPFIGQEIAMIRLALSICTIAALGLAGCSTTEAPLPAATLRTTDGTPVVSASATPVASASSGASAHRPGFGIIESISLVNPPASASAGGTSAPVATGPYRLTMRMDDGSIQTTVVDNRAFLVGDRVQVLPDGRIIRA
jgi:hypothetical protein